MSGRLYCFAVVAASMGAALDVADLPAPLPGDDALRRIRIGQLAVLCAPTTADTVAPKRRALRTHAAMLDALHARGTVLPMRFGTLADDEAALGRVIAAEHDALVGYLARVAGRSEYALRLSVARGALVEAAMAADPTLAQRHAALPRAAAARQRAAIDLGRHVAEGVARARRRWEQASLATLRALGIETVLQAPETDDEILRAAVLTNQAETDALTQALDGRGIEGAPRLPPDLTVRLVGPSPVYSFATIRLSGLQHGVEMPRCS
ncbi:MAG: GvpL/GvpF family gas vesicle protein [Pseudomonadota bacterium]